MPDVIELITKDHREVEDLFAKFTATKDRSVAETICEELDRHTAGEEQAVYPEVRADVGGGDRLMDEGEEEHREARQLIGRIRRTDDAEHLAELMTELEAAIQHHVQEEEGEVLPKLQQATSDQQRSEMADAFTTAKQQATV